MPKASADAGQKTGHRVVVLTDRATATQSISFTKPLEEGGGDVSVELFTHHPAHLIQLTRDDFWSRQKPAALFLSRQAHPRVFPVLRLARQHGVPSVFHIDDDLLDVTTALEAERAQYYQDPERIRVLRSAMNLVDLVYASTEPLAIRLAEHGISTKIVAGDIYCSIDPAEFVKPLPASGPVIGYMGSAGHSQDLAQVMPTIVKLMHDIPSLRFETFGTIAQPPEMAPLIDRYSHHAGEPNYASFLRRLRDLGWWVGIAPLVDNTFNRCKADTKWVEYSLAGMAVVASDLPVYHRACADGSGLLATTPDDWYKSLAVLVRSGEMRRTLLQSARSKLAAHYTHAALQQQVRSVIELAQAQYGLHQLDD